MNNLNYNNDVTIIGAGIAGIVCALEIMDNDVKNNTDHKIMLIDRDVEAELGGLAKYSFGGILIVGTPEQKRANVHDSVEIALQDWYSFGEFGQDVEKEKWAWSWAENYVRDSKIWIYDWLKQRGVSFLPMPLWVERGNHGGGTTVKKGGGNTVPRWHVVWGTGHGLVNKLVATFNRHPKRQNVTLVFEHQVTELIENAGTMVGCAGTHHGQAFIAKSPVTVITAGGINGNIDMVRQHWHKDWHKPPAKILNGAHKYADGTLHTAAKKIGANITFLENQWNYAAGVHHWRPTQDNHGLSLVPPRSALWLDPDGNRIVGDIPLVTGFDTRDLVTQVCKHPDGYSWQILNYKIAKKEFAISGSEFNPAIRDASKFKLLKDILFGNKALVNEAIQNCDDIVIADSIPELVEKMNALNANDPTVKSKVKLKNVQKVIQAYDAQIDLGEGNFHDEQLKRIALVRQWRGDKMRTCKFQKINDPSATPFIAIREYIVSRKSLGGIQTNLSGQVLMPSGRPIKGLYAAGEATGFGGGGMNGLRGLEGTFLGGCIYSGRRAGLAISQL